MKLANILKEVFNEKLEDHGDDTDITSFPEWDSMTHMLFITKLEEAYDIVLDGAEISTMLTVGDLKKTIEKKGREL